MRAVWRYSNAIWRPRHHYKQQNICWHGYFIFHFNGINNVAYLKLVHRQIKQFIATVVFCGTFTYSTMLNLNSGLPKRCGLRHSWVIESIVESLRTKVLHGYNCLFVSRYQWKLNYFCLVKVAMNDFTLHKIFAFKPKTNRTRHGVYNENSWCTKHSPGSLRMSGRHEGRHLLST